MEKQKHSEGMSESKDYTSSKKIDVLLGSEKVGLTIQEIEGHQAAELSAAKSLAKKKKRTKEENARMALAQNNLKALNRAHTLISKKISVTPSAATPASQRSPVATISESPSSKSKGSKIEAERKPLTEDEKKIKRGNIARSFGFLKFDGITDDNFKSEIDVIIESNFPNPEVFDKVAETDTRRAVLEGELREAVDVYNKSLKTEEPIVAVPEAAPSSVTLKRTETAKENKKLTLDSLSSDSLKLLGLNEREISPLRTLPDDLKKAAENLIEKSKQDLEVKDEDLRIAKAEPVTKLGGSKIKGDYLAGVVGQMNLIRRRLKADLSDLVDKNRTAATAASKRKPEVEVPVVASEKSKDNETVSQVQKELDDQIAWRTRKLDQIDGDFMSEEEDKKAAKDKIIAEYAAIIGPLEARLRELGVSIDSEASKTTPKSDTTPTVSSSPDSKSTPAQNETPKMKHEQRVTAIKQHYEGLLADQQKILADLLVANDKKENFATSRVRLDIASLTKEANSLLREEDRTKKSEEYYQAVAEIDGKYDGLLASDERLLRELLAKSGGTETPAIKEVRDRIAPLQAERENLLRKVHEKFYPNTKTAPLNEPPLAKKEAGKDIDHDPDSEVEIEVVPPVPEVVKKGVFESGGFDVQNNPHSEQRKNENSIVVDANLTEEIPFLDAELHVEPRAPWAQLELNGNKFEYAFGDYVTFNVGGTWEVGIVQDVEPKLSADGTQVELVVKNSRTHEIKTILISEPVKIFTPLRAKEFSINGIDYTAEDGHFTPNGEIEYRLVSARNEVLPFVSLETINNLLEIEEGKAEMMRNIENIEDRIHKLANEKVGELMKQLTDLHLKSLDIGRKAGSAREWGAYDAGEIQGMRKKIEELRRMLRSSFADLGEEIDRQDKKFREYEKGELHAPIIDRIKREMRKKNLTPALKNTNEDEYYRKLEEIFRGVIGDVPFGDLLYEEAEKRGVRGNTKGIEAIIEEWSKESRKPEIDVKKEQTALQDQLKPLRKKIEDLPLKDTEKDALLAEYKTAKDLCDAIQEGDKQAAIAILKALQAIGKLEVRVATLERPAQSNRETGKRRELVELPSSLIHDLLAAHPAEMQRLVELLYKTPPPVGTDRADIADNSTQFKLDFTANKKDVREKRRALEFSTENAQITAALKDLFRTQPDTATTAALRLHGIRDWAEFRQVWDASYAGNVGVALYDSLRNDINDRLRNEKNKSITKTKKTLFGFGKDKTEHDRFETNAEKEARIIRAMLDGEKQTGHPDQLSDESLQKFSAEMAIALRKVNLEAKLNDPKNSDPKKADRLSSAQEEILADAGYSGTEFSGRFESKDIGKNNDLVTEIYEKKEIKVKTYNNAVRFVGGRWRVVEGVDKFFDKKEKTNESLNEQDRAVFKRLGSVEVAGSKEGAKDRLQDLIDQTRASLRLIREATERGRVLADLKGSFDQLGSEVGKCYEILRGTSADQNMVELAGHSPFNKLLEDIVLEGRTFSKQFEALVVERKQLETSKKAQDLLDKVKISGKEKKAGTKETPAKKKARETVERSFVKSKTARALVLAGLGLAGGIYKGLSSSNGGADITPEQPTASAPQSNSVRSPEARPNAPVAASRPEIVPSRTARVGSLARAGVDSIRGAADRFGSMAGLSESAPNKTGVTTSEVLSLIDVAFPNSDKFTLVGNLQKALTVSNSEGDSDQVKKGWENLKLKPGDSATVKASKSEFVKSNLGSILREIGEAPITPEQASALREQIARAAKSQF
jgi:hypothetical protein